MDNWLDINRKLWDAKVLVHLKSDFYETEAFLAGKNVLTHVEMEALAGQVAGRKMLHLQCHFGQDSLCWARLGARVTGVDFSQNAIKTARKLSRDTGLKAHFVESDIYALPEKLDGRFDIVFTSWGTIGWLPDLKKWAAVVRHFLKKGGTFYIADFHPWLQMYDWPTGQLAHDWFNTRPIVEQLDGTYADPSADLHDTEVGWNHSFEETLGSLLGAGLRLVEMREFDHSLYPCFPGMREREPGKFVWGDFGERRLPHAFSLKMVG